MTLLQIAKKLVRKKSPHAKPREQWDFVPVIFANGVDDDLMGIEAAVKNERVQYEEKVYKPGEDITIDGKKIRLKCSKVVFMDPFGGVMWLGSDHHIGPVITIRTTAQRHLTINGGFIHMGTE